MLKRILSLLLVFLLTLSLFTACGKSEEEPAQEAQEEGKSGAEVMEDFTERGASGIKGANKLDEDAKKRNKAMEDAFKDY